MAMQSAKKHIAPGVLTGGVLSMRDGTAHSLI